MFSLLSFVLTCNQLVLCHVKPDQKLELEVQDKSLPEVLQLEVLLVKLAPVLEALVEELVVDLERPMEEQLEPVLEALVEELVVDLEWPLEEPLEQVQEVEVAGNPVEERPHEAQVLLAKSN